MQKRPPIDPTASPAAPGLRLRRKTLRVLTEAELGAVNGARRTIDSWTTGVWNDCNTATVTVNSAVC